MSSKFNFKSEAYPNRTPEIVHARTREFATSFSTPHHHPQSQKYIPSPCSGDFPSPSKCLGSTTHSGTPPISCLPTPHHNHLHSRRRV
eukprot:jgi/Botrbrau1/5231/Bobra.0172s0094.1